MHAFLSYLSSPTVATLGHAAWAATAVSLILATSGLACFVLARRWAKRVLGQVNAPGPGEAALRAEWRMKVGVGLAVWCSALVLAL
ncbi:MAG: hypothetical protein ACR2JY_13455 [Chloroflexota bacterium]